MQDISGLFKRPATTQSWARWPSRGRTAGWSRSSLALSRNRQNLRGWVYDIETGPIHGVDGATGGFVTLADRPQTPRRLPPHAASPPDHPPHRRGNIMIHSQNTQDPREELTAAIIDAKMRKNLSWQDLAEGTGLSLVFVTAALLGQHPLPAAAAETVTARLGLGQDAVLLLQTIPLRGSIPGGIPTDPTIYRFYEMVQVYGSTLKALVHEQFGDGIISAINFKLDIKKVEDPDGGSRAVITLDGKYLPTKPF